VLGHALWCPRRWTRSSPSEETQPVELELASPLGGHAGLKLVAAGDDRATMTLPADTPGPAVGGARRGAMTLLVEAAGMAAALGPGWTDSEEQARELFVTFLRPAPDHPLTAEARVMSRAGRRRNCEVEVRDWDGELVAKGFLSCDV
jgi:acyl-coenzyme A thioesterase PaaI-like protein